MVVQGAEDRRLMTSMLFTVSEKSMAFPLLFLFHVMGTAARHGRGSVVVGRKKERPDPSVPFIDRAWRGFPKNGNECFPGGL